MPVTVDQATKLLSQSPHTKCDQDHMPTSLFLKYFSSILLPKLLLKSSIYLSQLVSFLNSLKDLLFFLILKKPNIDNEDLTKVLSYISSLIHT